MKTKSAVSCLVRGILLPALLAGAASLAAQAQEGAEVFNKLCVNCHKEGCSAGQPGAVALIPGVVFATSLDGHLRAYSTGDGKMIWDFDTLQDFKTVNGVKARGGSMNGTGPVVAGGMLFSKSGYSRNPVMPGNVFLAFSVDGN